MVELAGCECHYIRCLKPNEQKKKDYFVPSFVFQQIKYLGILDTIRVRNDGYPCRKRFRDFFFRFEEVCFWAGKKSRFDYEKIADEAFFKDIAIKCLDDICPGKSKKEVLIGTTRLFMKTSYYANLEKLRSQKIRVKDIASRKVGKVWRGTKVKKKYKKIRKAGKKISNWYKCLKIRLKMKRKRKLVVKIQSVFRKFRVKKKMKKILEEMRRIKLIIRIQSFFRAYKVKKKMRAIAKEMEERRKILRKLNEEKKRCAILIQSFVRRQKSKKKLKKIKTSGMLITRYMRIFLRRFKVQRKNKVKKILYTIIDKAWFMLMNKIKVKYAVRIQARVRGFLAKIKNWKKVQQGRKKK